MSARLEPAVGPYLEQILRESFPLWGEGLTFDQYRRFWQAQLKTPWGARHLDRVALVESGVVTSSAKRYDLQLRLDGERCRALGVGAVFTSPARRGRGGARRLLEHVLADASDRGYDCAVLFSEIDPGFYQRLGFVPVPLVSCTIRVTRQGGTPAVLLRAGDDHDAPSLVEMGATRAAGARLSLERPEAFIRFGIARRRLLAGLGPLALRHVEFLVTEEGHQAVAYIVCTEQAGMWLIEEAGDRDPSGARMGAMLQAMLARAPHEEPPEIRAWLPHGFVPPQVEIVEERPVADTLMLRPLGIRPRPQPPLEARDVVYWHADAF